MKSNFHGSGKLQGSGTAIICGRGKSKGSGKQFSENGRGEDFKPFFIEHNFFKHIFWGKVHIGFIYINNSSNFSSKRVSLFQD